MNLYQCQEEAKSVGYDRAIFFALFPVGIIKCQWLDAYMGLFKINHPEMDSGFVMVKQIDEMFPDLEVTAPILEEDTPA